MNMKKIKGMSTAGTIICMISVIIYIALALWIFFNAIGLFTGFAGESMDKLQGVDSNSPSAGFEVLAYLAGGAIGVLGGMFSFLFTLFLGVLALYQLPAIISGFVANLKYKKGNDISKSLKIYEVDGYIKAIMNGIVVVMVCLVMAGDMDISSIKHIFSTVRDAVIMIICIWNYIIVLVLSILQLVNIHVAKKHKNI